jgi:hypothetical protein
MVAGLRSIAKAMESPPAPTVRAPAPDPTERQTEASAQARLLRPDTHGSEEGPNDRKGQ